MFIVRENHTFTRKIDISVPFETGFRKESFTATFLSIDTEEANELRNSGEESDAALLNKVFVGFEGVKDEDDHDVEDTEENRQLLMKVPYVALPLIKSFFNAVTGQKTKN